MAEMDAQISVGRPHQSRRRRVAGGRHHRHVVRVTPEEEGQLLALALRERVSVPKLLVEAALSQTGETPTERRNAMAELFALHRLLAAISNNVNQMAKVANATGQVGVEVGPLLDAVRRIADRIDETIDRLETP